jgi:hypothetical protein
MKARPSWPDRMVARRWRLPAEDGLDLCGEVLTKVCVLRTPKWTEPVNTQSDLTVACSEILANLWQTTLSGGPVDALCLVELRGFEPLTPCMPSRDPRHSTHHEPLRSKLLQRSRKTARGGS